MWFQADKNNNIFGTFKFCRLAAGFPCASICILCSLTCRIACFPARVGQARENGREAGQPDDRPNILFILSDDHTSQTWGIYGSVLAEYAQADNIKRLASEGVILDNCFCVNSLSTPSRASILTGRYSHMNGVYTLEDSLGTDIPTLGPGCAISGRESTDFRPI